MTSDRKKLIAWLDKYFSDLVKKRDNHTCQKCRSNTKQLNCCHFYSRKYFSVRWEMENAITLCVGCHFYFHHNPAEFAGWYKDKVGEPILTWLSFKKNNVFKTNLQNLQLTKMWITTAPPAPAEGKGE
jgi:hypothetical protein